MKRETAYTSGIFGVFTIGLLRLLLYPYLYRSGVGNIVFYILSSMVFILVFFVSAFLLESKKTILPYYSKELSFLLIILFVLWFVGMVLTEPTLEFFDLQYCLRQRIPHIFYFPVLFLTAIPVFFVALYIHKKNKIMRIVVSILLAGLQGCVLFAPNIIHDRGGTIYHIHAYTNSILNAADFVPFDKANISIYGHYSIFYAIPVKIMRLAGIPDIISVVFITSILGFGVFLLLYYCLGKIIKRDGIYYLSVISISYISFYHFLAGQYYQLIPHRLFPVALTLFAVVHLFTKEKRNHVLLWIITVFSYIWNFETGVVGSIVVAFAVVLSEWQKKENRKIIPAVFEGIGLVFGSFAAAFCLTNIYNLIVGGRFIGFWDFLYPLGNNNTDAIGNNVDIIGTGSTSVDYSVGALELMLPDIFGFCFLEIGVFMIALCYSIICWIRKKHTSYTAFLFLVSLLGLGLFPYYCNRAAVNNISITHIPFVILIAMLMQKAAGEVTGIKGNALKMNLTVSICGSVILSFFLLGTFTGIPLTIGNRMETSWKYSVFKDFCAEFAETVPEETVAMGVGLPEIYSVIHRSPGIYVGDWCNYELNETIQERAHEKLSETDSVVTDTISQVSRSLNDDEWIKVENIGGEYTYYVKIKNPEEGKEKAIIKYATDNNLSKQELLNIVFLNYAGGYPDQETQETLLEYFADCNDYEVITKTVVQLIWEMTEE